MLHRSNKNQPNRLTTSCLYLLRLWTRHSLLSRSQASCHQISHCSSPASDGSPADLRPIGIVPCRNRGLKSIAIFTHKQSLWSIDMKTKVVQHVPRINISNFNFEIFLVPIFCLTKKFTPIGNSLH